MPVIVSTKRALRKATSNHINNVEFKEAYKKLVKDFLAKPTEEGLKEVFSRLDKAEKRDMFHKNKISRLKSQYSKRLANKDVVKTVVKKTSKKKVSMKKSSK